MNWYRRSMNDHDTHRGHLRRGRVLAACGMEFWPLRAWWKGGSALLGEPSDSEQVCLECYRTSSDTACLDDRTDRNELFPALQSSPRVDRSESHD
jgi:hypothetical protein